MTTTQKTPAQIYSIWTEGGGQGKTTLTASLAKAHSRAGFDVLAIDMDGQKAGLSSHFGLLKNDTTPNGDNFGDFLANNATDPISDLIQTRNGVDIIPRTKEMRNIGKYISTHGGPREDEVPDEQLRTVIKRENLHQKYDFIIIDLPAGINTASKNGLFASRNVLIPMNPDDKGHDAVDGIISNLISYKRRKAIDEFGILAIVFNAVPSTEMNVTERTRNKIRGSLDAYSEYGFDVPISPVEISQRVPLFKESYKAGADPFTYFHSMKENQYDTERRTLHDIDLLGQYIIYQLTKHLDRDTLGFIPDESQTDLLLTDDELFPGPDEDLIFPSAGDSE